MFKSRFLIVLDTEDITLLFQVYSIAICVQKQFIYFVYSNFAQLFYDLNHSHNQSIKWNSFDLSVNYTVYSCQFFNFDHFANQKSHNSQKLFKIQKIFVYSLKNLSNKTHSLIHKQAFLLHNKQIYTQIKPLHIKTFAAPSSFQAIQYDRPLCTPRNRMDQ